MCPGLGVRRLVPRLSPVGGVPVSVLTLFCGPPGAGKTTVARQLEAHGAGLRLCTDEWQNEIGLPMDDEAAHGLLQARLYRLAMALLKRGVDVVLEDGLWTRAERERVFSDARARGARIHWHVFDVEQGELQRRLDERRSRGGIGAAPVSAAELRRILAVFESPTAAELAEVDEVTWHR